MIHQQPFHSLGGSYLIITTHFYQRAFLFLSGLFIMMRKMQGDNSSSWLLGGTQVSSLLCHTAWRMTQGGCFISTVYGQLKVGSCTNVGFVRQSTDPAFDGFRRPDSSHWFSHMETNYPRVSLHSVSFLGLEWLDHGEAPSLPATTLSLQ